jgi:hypothetical protein
MLLIYVSIFFVWYWEFLEEGKMRALDGVRGHGSFLFRPASVEISTYGYNSSITAEKTCKMHAQAGMQTRGLL